MPLPELILEVHNNQFVPDNLPMPTRGGILRITTDLRISRGTHGFHHLDTRGQFYYWVYATHVKLGVYITDPLQNQLDILYQRAAAIHDVVFGGGVNPTIVLYVQGGTNNVGEYDRIAQESLTRMKDIWRVLQGIQ